MGENEFKLENDLSFITYKLKGNIYSVIFFLKTACNEKHCKAQQNNQLQI